MTWEKVHAEIVDLKSGVPAGRCRAANGDQGIGAPAGQGQARDDHRDSAHGVAVRHEVLRLARPDGHDGDQRVRRNRSSRRSSRAGRCSRCGSPWWCGTGARRDRSPRSTGTSSCSSRTRRRTPSRRRDWRSCRCSPIHSRCAATTRTSPARRRWWGAINYPYQPSASLPQVFWFALREGLGKVFVK